MLIGLSLVSYVVSILFPDIKLPFGIETALTATVFYGLGYLWNTNGPKLTQQIKIPIYTIMITALAVMIVSASINFELYGYQIDLRLNRYGNYLFFYLAALGGILSVATFSILLKKNSLLETIGKHSLPLFVWHIIIFTYLTEFSRQFISLESFTYYRTFVIAPIFTILTTILILVGVYISNTIKRSFTKKHG
jgi:fucose 4-O-acetylase-like acetyltransferase